MNWDAFSSFLTAAGTIGLAIIGYWQLEKIIETNKNSNAISQENFLYKLREGFFTDPARDLITLIEEEAMQFDRLNEIFTVDIDDERKKFLKYSINVNKKYYTPQEIDDFLLGPLEDVGTLLKKELITIEDVSQNFQYYLETVLLYTPIEKYILWARDIGEDQELYIMAQKALEDVENFEN